MLVVAEDHDSLRMPLLKVVIVSLVRDIDGFLSDEAKKLSKASDPVSRRRLPSTDDEHIEELDLRV
jgi:hypothetical protein